MQTTRILITAIVTALALPAFAADEHKHKEGKDHPKVEVKIPDTAAALWTEIDAKSKELTDLVTAKKGDKIHVAAETVEALVNAIPSKHADLAADKKKRVEGMAKNVARVLDQIHEEAEEGHWDDATKKLGQVEAALKLIKQQIGK
jgi:hypothetical protein